MRTNSAGVAKDRRATAGASEGRGSGKPVGNTQTTVIHVPAPNPKQRLFLRDKHKYLGFGGARGGGKTWVIRVQAMTYALKYPGIKVMIIRRSYPELRSNHIIPMQELIGRNVARYVDVHKELTFTNGSTIQFRYCESARDMPRYQGLEVDVLFIDEATQFAEEVFKMFLACVRGVNDFPKRVYLTFNPGGVGHGWVKRLFIDRAYQKGEHAGDYAFIQSLVTDNRVMLKKQPEYLEQLDALPPKLRAAWRFGRWDIFEGQFFEEFTVNPNPERVRTHVIAPFDPPASWKRYRSYDWGYGKPFSCGWWVVDHEGRYYRILELYGCTDTPDEGVKWTNDEQFAEIARIEREHPWLKGHKIDGVADTAIWTKEGNGVSAADAAAKFGVYFQRANKDRISGWMQVHYRLHFDDNGLPMMYVFDNCKAFIRTMPLLIYDEHKPEDLDTKGEDHVADEVRYFCMLNPLRSPRKVERPVKPYDPLDREPVENKGEYEFFRIG